MARRLRPDFRLRLKYTEPNRPMVHALLVNRSPTRRLRPRPHIYLTQEKGKKIAFEAVEVKLTEAIQIVGQEHLMLFTS